MKKTLAERLEFLLSNLGIRRRDFSERVGFTQSYLSMILNGTKKSPSARFFDAVAREFSINPDWLRSGEGEVYTVPGFALAPADAEIIARYRLLPPAEQAIVDEIINALLLKSLGGNAPEK
ncbi:MAG: helix-turn-helix domain-containing protein [Treponema sp.]|nr:helix-turn-helix domain-containing protein [Treponema sp.]